MNYWETHIINKIVSRDTAAGIVKDWRTSGQKVVFTNGCFDLLHFGHVRYLADARSLGDRLVVALNSGDSIRRLKGSNRPINDEMTRETVMASLAFVDLVIVFDEDTPYELIRLLLPDILVKGGDWQPADIVGSDIVAAHGGTTLSLPYIDGYSTTRIEEKIRKG